MSQWVNESVDGSMGQWVMGLGYDGSDGSWVTNGDPWSTLPCICIIYEVVRRIHSWRNRIGMNSAYHAKPAFNSPIFRLISAINCSIHMQFDT